MDKPATAHVHKTMDVADTHSFMVLPAFSPFFITWLVMLFCIVGTGYWFYQQQMTYNRQLAFERVRDIGDLRSNSIVGCENVATTPSCFIIKTDS